MGRACTLLGLGNVSTHICLLVFVSAPHMIVVNYIYRPSTVCVFMSSAHDEQSLQVF